MRNMPVLYAIMVAILTLPKTACPEDVSLNGSWRFAYTSSPSPAKVVERFTVAVMIRPNPQLPTDDQFAVDMRVPGYWDDQLSYVPEARWGNKVGYYGGQTLVPSGFPTVAQAGPGTLTLACRTS